MIESGATPWRTPERGLGRRLPTPRRDRHSASLTPYKLATLRESIEANLAQPSVRAKIASRPDAPGRFFEDFCNWQHNDSYRNFVFETPPALAAQRQMGSHTVLLHRDDLPVMNPGTLQRRPWHQDQPSYNINGQQNVSLWIPVDPVSCESRLEFVAGSHRGPWLLPRTFMDHLARWLPEGSLADMPDIEGKREQFPSTSLQWRQRCQVWVGWDRWVSGTLTSNSPFSSP